MLKAPLALLAATAALFLLPAQSTPDPFTGARPGAPRAISGLAFHWIPPGSFRMGSPPDEPERRADEGPVDVTLTRGFWIAKYEVTQGEWTSLMGAFPREQDRGAGPDFPVYWVNWIGANEFCRRLTVRARASGTLPDTWEIRLPTEAQWEYAYRAGTTAATSFGPRLDRTQANIGASYPGRAAPRGVGQAVKVGSYPANSWGLHDMHGSVWEWCLDWYHRALPAAATPTFPLNPASKTATAPTPASAAAAHLWKTAGPTAPPCDSATSPPV